MTAKHDAANQALPESNDERLQRKLQENTPFLHPIRVADRDIDGNGHANNVSYVRWVQDAAVAHWRAVLRPEAVEGLSWVLVRHEIDYKRPALQGDELVVRTWVEEVTAATIERFCELLRLSDQALLAKSRTIWCAIDANSGKPKRISPQIKSFFFGDKEA